MPADPANPAAPRFLVAQLGARMHYAVARLLHEEGMLAALHTDVCAARGWPALVRRHVPRPFLPRALRALLERDPRGLPPALIRAHTWLGTRYAWERHRARDLAAMSEIHLRTGRAFCERVVRAGLGGAGGEAAGIFVYNSAGLELLRAAREAGLIAAMEQTILPRALQFRLLAEERERFPDHETTATEDPLWEAYARREADEWAAADTILCGSAFVADGIREVGGPADKTRVVPYGVEIAASRAGRIARGEPAPPLPAFSRARPLRVLFVGQVGLRKGAHYLLEAASLLRDEPVVFRLVGHTVFGGDVLERAPASVVRTGAVSRRQMPRHYRWGDVLCLPSLVEGSATATYEALAAGLPVITTPNAGSVVRDGATGYLVPPRDPEAIASAIRRYLAAPFALPDAPQPLEYSLEAYGVRLRAALRGTKGD